MTTYTISGQARDAAGVALANVPVRAHSRATGALLAADVSADGNITLGDANFSNVVFMANFESGVAEDLSAYKRMVTPYGSVSSVRGAVTSAKSFTGRLTCPSSADFSLPGDFTMETELYVNSWSPGMQGVFDIGNYSNLMFRLQSNLIEVWFAGGATNIYLLGGAVVPVNTWHHLAITRQSNTVRVWFNGAKCGSDFTYASPIASGVLTLGAAGHATGSEYLNGFMDEVRITKGVARYSAPFTRPTAPNKPYANRPAMPVGNFTLNLGAADPGEVQVVFLDPTGDPLQNDVVHRAFPVAT